MNPQHTPPPQDDPLLLAAVFRLLKSMRGDRVLIGVQEARSVTTKEVIKRQVLSEGAADRYWWSALWSREMMRCFQGTGKELHRTVSNGFLGRSSSVLNGCRVVYNRALTKLSGQEGNFYLSSQAEHLRRCLEDGIILRECELDSDQCVSQEQFQRRSHNCRTRERNNLAVTLENKVLGGGGLRDKFCDPDNPDAPYTILSRTCPWFCRRITREVLTSCGVDEFLAVLTGAMLLGLHLPDPTGERTALDFLKDEKDPLNRKVMEFLDQRILTKQTPPRPRMQAAVKLPISVQVVTDFTDQEQLGRALLHNQHLLTSKKVTLGAILPARERNWFAFAQEEYEKKNFAAAEYVYSLMSRGGNLSAGVLLAQMIRRRETVLTAYTDAFALDLLDNLERRIPTHADTLVNLALIFAVNLEPTHAGWEKGLSFIRRLTQSGAYDASAKWENLGPAGDPEGELVHLMLLWEGKLEYSPLGSFMTLYRRMCERFPDFPQRCGLEIPAKDTVFHTAEEGRFPVLFSLRERRYQFVVCIGSCGGEDTVLVDKIGDLGRVGIDQQEYARIYQLCCLLELQERKFDLS